MVELSNQEEVAEGVGSKLHVVTLCSVFVLGWTHDISDTEEHADGGFLPAVMQTGRVSMADAVNENQCTSGMLRRTG